MNTVRAMKSPRACIPLSPNTIRQTKGSGVRSPAGSQRTGGDYDGKVSGRPRSARLERANEPRRLALDHVRLRQELSRRAQVHLDREYSCLTRYGHSWRSAAVAGLSAVGL